MRQGVGAGIGMRRTTLVAAVCSQFDVFRRFTVCRQITSTHHHVPPCSSFRDGMCFGDLNTSNDFAACARCGVEYLWRSRGICGFLLCHLSILRYSTIGFEGSSIRLQDRACAPSAASRTRRGQPEPERRLRWHGTRPARRLSPFLLHTARVRSTFPPRPRLISGRSVEIRFPAL